MSDASSGRPPFVPKMSVSDIMAFYARHCPERLQLPIAFEALASDGCTARLAYRPDQLRPGGTLAGPVPMNLADTVGLRSSSTITARHGRA